jgi:hypothetical protein
MLMAAKTTTTKAALHRQFVGLTESVLLSEPFWH